MTISFITLDICDDWYMLQYILGLSVRVSTALLSPHPHIVFCLLLRGFGE